MAEVVEDSKYKKYFMERFNRDEHPQLYIWRQLNNTDYFDKIIFKNEHASESKRTEGNSVLKQGNFYEAIKLFTESAAYANNNSITIAKAFGNRSAASFAGGLYPECIKDVELAFQHGYPEKDSYKLLIRQAAAYNFLNLKPDLKNTIKKIIELDPKLTEDKIMDSLKEKISTEKIIEAYYSDKLPSVAYGKSPEAPCASSALRIEYDDKYGRHLVATRDIKMGDVLIVEESYSNFVIYHARYTHCNYCLKHCLTLIPCENCTWAMFCSKECLDEANKQFHKEECAPISRYLLACISLQLGDKFHVPFAMRTLAKIGYKNCQSYFDRMNRKEQILSKEEKRTAGFINGVYDSSNFETIFNLQDHYEIEDPRNKQAASAEAQVAIKCIGLNLKDEYTQNFAALYMKLRMNSFINCVLSISEQVYYLDNITTDECGKIIGERIYSNNNYHPYHLLLAHSCSPNVACYNNGKTMITYATVPIYKGDKIFMCYVGGCEHDRLRVRKEIKERHHFICDCEMCIKFQGFDPKKHEIHPNSTKFPLHVGKLSEKLSLTPNLLLELLKYRNERNKFNKKINQDISIRYDFFILNHSKYKHEFILRQVRNAVVTLNLLKGSLIIIKNSKNVNYPNFDFTKSLTDSFEVKV